MSFGLGTRSVDRSLKQKSADGVSLRRSPCRRFLQGSCQIIWRLLSPVEVLVHRHRRVLDTVVDPRFAGLTPARIVAILAEERIYVSAESPFFASYASKNLLKHSCWSRQPRDPRPVPKLEEMVMHVWRRRILGTEVYECEPCNTTDHG